MFYKRLECLHPWIDYFSAFALLYLGLRSLMQDGELLGVVPALLGLALGLARIASFKVHPTPVDHDAEPVPQGVVRDDGSLL